MTMLDWLRANRYSQTALVRAMRAQGSRIDCTVLSYILRGIGPITPKKRSELVAGFGALGASAAEISSFTDLWAGHKPAQQEAVRGSSQR